MQLTKSIKNFRFDKINFIFKRSFKYRGTYSIIVLFSSSFFMKDLPTKTRETHTDRLRIVSQARVFGPDSDLV